LPLSCVASTGVFWLSLSSRIDLCLRPFGISSCCVCIARRILMHVVVHGVTLPGCAWMVVMFGTMSKVAVTKAAESRTIPSSSTPAPSTLAALASQHASH
jgi:hypothetical protein